MSSESKESSFGRTFERGAIDGVDISPLKKFVDTRGWLAELWRTDRIDPAQRPVMSYISVTEPGVARGPHEHRDQTDVFSFLGPGNFEIHLWDNRPDSPTYDRYHSFVVGQDSPTSVTVPPRRRPRLPQLHGRARAGGQFAKRAISRRKTTPKRSTRFATRRIPTLRLCCLDA